MTEIVTTHRGYKVTYSENQDIWRCWDLDLQHGQLSKLKQRMDAMLRRARKPEAFACLYLDDGQSASFKVVTVTTVTATQETDYRQTVGGRFAKKAVHKAWVMIDKQRRQVRVDELVADTAENRAAIECLAEAHRVRRAAEAAFRVAREAIPRLTAEAIVASGEVRQLEEESADDPPAP